MQVLVIRLRTNLPVINISFPLRLWLALGVTWMLSGCVLVEYPPLDFLDFQKPKVPDAYRRGVQYYWEGHYKSAQKELETVPPNHPRFKRAQDYLTKATTRVMDATAHVNTALRYRREDELFRAKTEFEEALEVYPKYQRVQMLLEALEMDIEATANFYYEKGQEEFGRRDYESARDAFLEALKADPEENRVLVELARTNEILGKRYFKEGTALFQKGSFDEAIKRLEKAYQINSSDPFLIKQLTNIYNRRALKFYREEKLSLAVADLKRSLEIKSEQEEIRMQLQQIKERLGLLKKIRP